MKKEDNEKIKALIILILLLLLGGVIGIILEKSFQVVQVNSDSTPSCSCDSGRNFLSIISMPFFYIIEYPKMLMGISNGDFYNSAPSAQSQKPKKQFIKY